MEKIATRKMLDRRGKTITTYVVFDVLAELDTMRDGEVLDLITDDFQPFEHDIAAWCQATGHVLLSSERVEEGRRFLIERRTQKLRETRLAMIISANGLDELLSPLGFALGAALEGIEVSLYFQGPAVRVLADGFQPKLKGWARPFSRFAAAGMTKAGHIPAQEKLHQLRSLGAHIYACGGSMEPFKVRQEDLIFNDLPIVEYLTFMAIMEDADIQLYI
jgi:predicted peroxiredoxin/TusA-related sulfurtransferase